MKHVLLLRGINVGGHGKLPMADLRELLTGLGAENVRTYIQSGNAVFDGTLTAEEIVQAIVTKAGFRRPAMVLSDHAFHAILGANPFGPEAEADPKSVHVWIGAAPLRDLETSITALASGERIQVAGQACYLHAPNGIGRSKLVAKLDQAFGQPVTARNWRTMTAIAAML